MKKLYLLTLAALVGCTSPTVVKKTSPPLPPGLKSVSRAKAASPKAAEAAPRAKAAGPAGLPIFQGFPVSREIVVVADGQAVNSAGRVTNVFYPPAIVVRFTNAVEGTWRIERSTNLVDWVFVGNSTPLPTMIDMVDAPCAFYRCIMYPPPGTKLFPLEPSAPITPLPPPRSIPRIE